MRTIKKIHKAEYRPIEDLVTYSPLPTRSLDQIDPFLLLNHHGPQHYSPGNKGLPFGPHPHRGMETVTFILEGDIAHQDSNGHKSVIKRGGIQWMTAGSGLIHAEVSSEEFREKGGDLEILQLWLNLPSKLKMTSPGYRGLQKEDIPEISLKDNKGAINLIAGNFEGQNGAFNPITDVFISTIDFKKEGALSLRIDENRNVFFYVIRGKLLANKTEVGALHLAEFDHDHERLDIIAEEDSILLLGHAEPLNEPVVARGPFVMNTEKEIEQAYEDFYQGKMGHW